MASPTMKRTSALLMTLGCSLLLISGLVLAPCQAQQQLVFNKIEKAVASAISVNVLKEAYAELGIDLVIRNVPAKRALFESNSGQVDGEINRIEGIEAQYSNLIRITVPVNFVDIALFSKRDDLIVSGWESLQSYSIGVVAGILVVEQKTKHLKPQSVYSFDQLVKMLDAGRFDIGITTFLSGGRSLSQLNYPEVKVFNPSLERVPLYHYLHKKHSNLVPHLTRVLGNMRENGRIQIIRDQALAK